MSHSDEHIGVGIHCLFLVKGFARTSDERISKKRFHAFFLYSRVVWSQCPIKLFDTMKNKFILICAIFCSLQMMATNLVLLKSDGSQQLQDIATIGKGVHQGCILSPCLFNLNAEYIMRNAGLDEAQAGIKIARRISITSDMQMTPPLWQKVKRNSKAS